MLVPSALFKLTALIALLLFIGKCICDLYAKACFRVFFQDSLSRGRSVLPASVENHTVPRKTETWARKGKAWLARPPIVDASGDDCSPLRCHGIEV